MTAFQYKDSAYPIREDLPQAYNHYWQALRAAGSWWTGAERVAIAQEVRNATQCTYCRERKQALSPYNFPGDHEHSGVLPERAVDAVHRIITDQSRITQNWIDENIAQGISEEQFVELLGITVTVFSIDEFNRALGLSPEALPIPTQGTPDNYRPALAERGTGYVAMLPGKGDLGEGEADLWPAGRSANVLRALSLVPDAVRGWSGIAAAQYLALPSMLQFSGDFGRSINRMQMEIIAGRVSSYNECFY